MRITNNMVYERLNANMVNNQDSLDEAQQRVMSGKKISKPSDNPGSAGKILEYKTVLSKIDRYNQNITSVQARLDFTSTMLGSATPTLEEIEKAARESLSTSNTAAERQQTAIKVGYFLNQLVDVANGKMGDSYLFAGYGGTTDPFDSSGNATQDISANIMIEVDNGVTVAANSPGDRVFKGVGVTGGVDVFSVINNLITALNANDDAGIQAAASGLGAGLKQFRAETVDIEMRKSFVSKIQERVTGIKNIITESLSKEEDVDMNTAVTDFRAKELALESTRAASGRVLNIPTLMDFLK